MIAPQPHYAAPKPQVHPEVANERLLALLLAQRLREEARFQAFLARALSPVEV